MINERSEDGQKGYRDGYRAALRQVRGGTRVAVLEATLEVLEGLVAKRFPDDTPTPADPQEPQ